MGMQISGPISTPTERRRCREQRSAEMRAQALTLREAGSTYAAIAKAMGISLERARNISVRAERLTYEPHWTDRLPSRAVLFLRCHQIDTLPEAEAARAVSRFTRRDLERQENLGRVSIDEIAAWLATHGLKMSVEISANYCRAPPALK
jgi:hypothetical protein